MPVLLCTKLAEAIGEIELHAGKQGQDFPAGLGST
jgi:hypothetical protein